MRKKPIGVQEIRVECRGQRPRPQCQLGIREFAIDEANDLQEILTVHIERDDLSRAEIAGLLKEHLASMFVHSPPESVHALPIEGLRSPDITFWSVWENGEVLGCGALKELDPQHGEIKSMRTASAHLRKGVARGGASHHRGSEAPWVSALEFGDRLHGCF